MRIGVAIPCYIGHLENLRVLLESIAKQTRLPEKVVVSCSSTTELPNFPIYNFDLIIACSQSLKNPSQNRNIAAKLLDVDIITFFDADDVMHPQRLEFIECAFSGGASIVLHNYIGEQEDKFVLYESPYITYDSLCQSIGGCIRHVNPNNRELGIHHSQVSVTRGIYNQIQFDENPAIIGKEDCVFCWCAFTLPNIKNAYISNKLSLYLQSNTYKLFC
jgi:glycosyltransferase involved in cell wall biosynthesis